MAWKRPDGRLDMASLLSGLERRLGGARPRVLRPWRGRWRRSSSWHLPSALFVSPSQDLKRRLGWIRRSAASNVRCSRRMKPPAHRYRVRVCVGGVVFLVYV
jgi:hypothetical protein